MPIISTYSEQTGYISKLIESILKQEVEKPKWMIAAEKYYNENYDSYSDRMLFITVKDEAYQPLADKILRFLNAVETKEHYD